MSNATCVESGCTKRVRSRGRCTNHYNRWIRATPRDQRPGPTDWERFTAKARADDSGCLIWTGGSCPPGYGRFWVNGRIVQTHRFALERHLGRPIREGMFACHTCDTPACVEATHLYEGTHQENVNDMTGQLRHAWGERNAQHKLTVDEVRHIRRLASQGLSQRAIADRYPVDQSAISRIVSGHRWSAAL